MASNPPDRANDSKRVLKDEKLGKPLISPALMRAFQSSGIGPEEAAVRVDSWNAKFKGADRVVPRSKNNDNFNSTNAFGD